MKTTLAIDIGGTQLRAAVFPENEDKPLRQKRLPTYVDGKPSLDRLLQLIHEVTEESETIDAIGIVAPGPINANTGVILAAPNLPEWAGVSISDLCQKEFGAPTFLGNDANLAAIGEWKYGAGRGHHHLIYMTISTGIGSGVISHDQLIVGNNGLASELGHVTLLPDGPMCGCGQRGHLEALASGTGIAKYFAEQLSNGRESILSGKPDAKTISKAAKEGDELALETFNRAGYYIGLAVANYLAIFNPSIVIFGGGVSQAGDLIMNPIRKAMRESVFSEHFLMDLELSYAELGDDVGLYGALALARESLGAIS